MFLVSVSYGVIAVRMCLYNYMLWNYPKRPKTYFRTCTLNEGSTQPAHPCSIIRVLVVRMKKPWSLCFPKCAQWRFWSDCANAQADLKLRLAHTSEYTFSDVVAHLFTRPAENVKSYLVRCKSKQLYYLRNNTGNESGVNQMILFDSSKTYLFILFFIRYLNCLTYCKPKFCNTLSSLFTNETNVILILTTGTDSQKVLWKDCRDRTDAVLFSAICFNHFLTVRSKLDMLIYGLNLYNLLYFKMSQH